MERRAKDVRFGYYIIADGREDPRRTLDHARLAEDAGFDTVWTGDHFEPFTHTDRNSPFAWVWLAAAAERTSRVQLGTGVTAPILRYNPAILAQAFATLGYLYPQRIFLGLGAGEAINESPCGYDWPGLAERVARVEEAIKIVKLLWESDDFVSFKGDFFQVKKARLYNKPVERVRIFVAATRPRISEIAGRYADGFLYQLGDPTPEKLRHFNSVVWPWVERGAKAVGRDASQIERVGTISSAYAEDREAAFRSAMGRKGSLLPEIYTDDIYDPVELERRSKKITDEEAASKMLITDKAEDYVQRVGEMVGAGFTHVYVSNWGPSQEDFLRLFKRSVLPELRRRYGGAR